MGVCVVAKMYANFNECLTSFSSVVRALVCQPIAAQLQILAVSFRVSYYDLAAAYIHDLVL